VDLSTQWFGPLAAHLAQVDLDPPEGVLTDRFVALIDPTSDDAKNRLRSLSPEVVVYFTLPMAVFTGTQEFARTVAAIPGVNMVAYAPVGSIESETLVHGFDILATYALAQRLSPPGTPDIYGGAVVGDVVTKPALMPVINFSVGPVSSRFPHRVDDPVNLATLSIAHEQLVVVAAGNEGPEQGETMSAWAESEWVLAVGGTSDRAGTLLAETSSRGVAERPSSGPDVVAYGASELNEALTGTSFAAPRVVRLAMLVSAAILQLRRPWLASLGAVVQGTELVGSGFIDVDYEALVRQFAKRDGLPPVGLQESDARECFDIVLRSGVELPVVGDPRLVRRILIQAARPIPGYGEHEVGAGFLDDEIVIRWLASRTGSEMVRWFDAAGSVDSSTHEQLAALQPFDEAGLGALLNAVVVSGPMWLYDYQLRRLGKIP
jgi:hypothetical protein